MFIVKKKLFYVPIIFGEFVNCNLDRYRRRKEDEVHGDRGNEETRLTSLLQSR